MRYSFCYKFTTFEHEFFIKQECGGYSALGVRSTLVDQTQPREAGIVLKEYPRLWGGGIFTGHHAGKLTHHALDQARHKAG